MTEKDEYELVRKLELDVNKDIIVEEDSMMDESPEISNFELS